MYVCIGCLVMILKVFHSNSANRRCATETECECECDARERIRKRQVNEAYIVVMYMCEVQPNL